MSLMTIYIHEESWPTGSSYAFLEGEGTLQCLEKLYLSVSQTKKEVVCFKIIKRNKILSTRHIFSDGALCYSA